MTMLKQSSFAGGELAPNVYGRSEQAKWQAGLAACRNFHVNRYGNVENRAGFDFGGITRDKSRGRTLGFVISAAQSYLLELVYDLLYNDGSDRYGMVIRPWVDNANLTVTTASLSAYAGGTTYGRGQIVTYGGGAWSSLADGNVGNTPAAGPHWFLLPAAVGGDQLVEIPMPEMPSLAAIKLLSYAQLNEVLFLTSQASGPFRLEYHSDAWWRLNTTVLYNDVGRPSGIASTVGTGSGTIYKYMVVGVGSDLTTQGPPSFGPPLAVSSIGTSNSPVTVHTAAAHNFSSGDTVSFDFTASAIEGVEYIVDVVDSTHFTLRGTFSPAAVSHLTPGNYFARFVAISCSTPSSSTPNVITWTAADNVAKYFLYRWYLGAWSFLGSTVDVKFDDINITPNAGAQPQIAIPMFQSANDYPAVVGVFQQRVWYANTINQPSSYWASRIGQYGVFNVSTPANASDAFTFAMAGRQVQIITGFQDIGKLIIHTAAGEFVVNGDQGGAITPTAQNIAQVGYAGSLPGIPPVGIGLTDLFVQAHGGQIRDLQFNVQVFNYAGKDCTLFASHLFQGRTIVDMAWQQTPDSILWCVMSDGALLGLTYIKEHEMWAWHRHDTAASGKVLSVAVIPEGGRDALYIMVQRTILGLTWVNIERQSQRAFRDITIDANFADSAVTYDGRNTDSSYVRVDRIGSGGWTTDDNLTMTASSAIFAAADVTRGNLINVRDIGTDAGGNLYVRDQIDFLIVDYTDTTHVTVQPLKTVPAWFQGINLTTYGKKVSHFFGATNLAGQVLAFLGDGYIEPVGTVTADSSGNFVTVGHYLILHAGLPIAAQGQTLDWENQQGETIAGKRKVINELILVLVTSRGGQFGQSLDSLGSYQARSNEPYDTPNYLITGPQRFPLPGQWTPGAQVWFTQPDPLPLCIAAIIPSGSVGN